MDTCHTIILKRIPSENAPKHESVQNMQQLHLYASCGGSISISMQQKYFIGSNLSSSGRSHVASLFFQRRANKGWHLTY